MKFREKIDIFMIKTKVIKTGWVIELAEAAVQGLMVQPGFNRGRTVNN